MRVLGKPRLRAFYERHADAKQDALAWLAEVESAEWRTPHDIKQRYPKASIIGNGRVVFNLRGNRYRLAITVAYQSQSIVITHVGTHAEYDRWDLS